MEIQCLNQYVGNYLTSIFGFDRICVTGAVNLVIIPSLSNAGKVYACTAWLSVATYSLLSLKHTARAFSPTQWEFGSSSSISSHILTSPSCPQVIMCLKQT